MSFQNQTKNNIITELENSETQHILNSLLKIGYQEKDEEDFMVEILGEQNEEIKEIAIQLNNQIRNISTEEVKRIAAPITMRVVSVNIDGTINVNKPTDKSSQTNCWTDIPNPTIFQYLQPGDEVVLGYYEGNQKSNCWVMFAKLTNDEIYKKTVYKDIDKIYTLYNDAKFLKNWIKTIISEVYPDIENTITDTQGTHVNYTPHPMRVRFEKELAEQWKEVTK